MQIKKKVPAGKYLIKHKMPTVTFRAKVLDNNGDVVSSSPLRVAKLGMLFKRTFLFSLINDISLVSSYHPNNFFFIFQCSSVSYAEAANSHISKTIQYRMLAHSPLLIGDVPDEYTEPEANDGIDNDGDYAIDEELLNSKDDDGDGLIDEDTASNEYYGDVRVRLSNYVNLRVRLSNKYYGDFRVRLPNYGGVRVIVV